MRFPKKSNFRTLLREWVADDPTALKIHYAFFEDRDCSNYAKFLADRGILVGRRGYDELRKKLGEEGLKEHMRRIGRRGLEAMRKQREKLLEEGGEEAVRKHYHRKLLDEGGEEAVSERYRRFNRLGVEAKRKQREKLLEEGGEEAVREHYLRLAKKGGRLSLLEQVKAERKQLEEEALRKKQHPDANHAPPPPPHFYGYPPLHYPPSHHPHVAYGYHAPSPPRQFDASFEGRNPP